MKWRISDAEYSALDADRQADYEREGDNGYVLAVIDEAGERVKPPEDAGPLKRAYEATKRERDQTREELAAIRADKDSGGSKARIELLTRRDEELTARLEQAEAEHKKAMADLDAHYQPLFAEQGVKLEASLAEADKLVLDYELANVIRDAGGVVELLAPKLERFCRVVRDPETGERRVAVFTDDNIERIDPATGLPVTPATALAELKIFDPRLAPAFNNNGSAPTGR
jgi:hypothetical protein